METNTVTEMINQLEDTIKKSKHWLDTNVVYHEEHRLYPIFRDAYEESVKELNTIREAYGY
jgi:hypothetical protein